MIPNKQITQKARKPLLIQQPVTVVESTLVPEEETLIPSHSTLSRVSPPWRRRAYRVDRQPWARRFLSFLLLASLVGVGILLLSFSFPTMISTTIVLFPRHGEETREVIINAVAHPTNAAQSLLRPQAEQMSAATSVPTSGLLTRPAQTAQGVLTIYNSTSLSYVLPEGMDIASSEGEHVVTVTPVTIPSSPGLPQLSTTHVLARAVDAGTRGNIAAGSISAQCPARYCGGNSVNVTNTSAFLGGQESQTLHIVVQTDIDHATSSVLTTLSTRGKRALLAHLLPTEQLVEKLPHCTAVGVSAFPPLGSSAIDVQVTATVLCQAVAYQPNDVTHHALEEAQNESPALPRGASLDQKGTIISHGVQDAAGAVIFHVSVWRKWSARLDPASVASFARHLVGQPVQNARDTILSDPRISDVSIEDYLLGSIPVLWPHSLANSPQNISCTVAD